MMPATPPIDQTSIAELPAFPTVVLSLLEVSGRSNANSRDVETVLRQDAALVTRLMGAANAAAFERAEPARDLHQAVARLGLARVNTLAIAAAVRGFFADLHGGQPDWLEPFWDHSVCCATLARRLAVTQGLPNVDQAYLAGLLHDIGKPMLRLSLGAEYEQRTADAETGERSLRELEHASWQTDHSEVGARVLSEWGLPWPIIDAARYHHEPVEALKGASPLLRSVALANVLCYQEEGLDLAGRHAAATLLDLGRAEVLDLVASARREQQGTRAVLEDSASSQRDQAGSSSELPLAASTRAAAITGGLGRALAEGDPVDNIPVCLTLLFGIRHVVLLSADRQGERLTPEISQGSDPSLADLRVPLGDTMSTPLAQAISTDEPARIDRADVPSNLSVAERQILDRIPGDTVIGLPLQATGQAVGLVLMGMRREQADAILDEKLLLRGFAGEAGALLGQQQQQRRALEDTHEQARASHRQRLEALVAEAATPLSVLRNYLSVLQRQLAEDHAAHGSLARMEDEVMNIKELIAGLEQDAESTWNYYEQ